MYEVQAYEVSQVYKGEIENLVMTVRRQTILDAEVALLRWELAGYRVKIVVA